MVTLSSEVEQRMNESASGDAISLIVTLETRVTEHITGAVESAGGVVEMQATDRHLAVTIDESNLAALADVDAIESIEIEGKGRVLESVDFRSHAG